MAKTIEVRLAEQHCPLGEAYARRHSTTPPKTAVTHALAPERTVRVCHGGLLEAAGGMRELVERADRILMLDGCSMACGTRLLKGGLPQAKPTVVFTDGLVDFDRSLFGVDEMPEEEIREHARTVAEKIAATTVQLEDESVGCVALPVGAA